MDTTKKYIEMCRRAVKIQEGWEPKDGDFVKCGARIHTIYMEFIGGNKLKYYYLPEGEVELELKREVDKNEIVWLPRQDQLVCILLESLYLREYNYCSGLCKMLDDFNYYIEIDHNDCFDPREDDCVNSQKSLDQLWLMFLMKEKYNKKWNGTDWEVIK